MNFDILKSLAQYAGIGGICVGIVLIIFVQIIALMKRTIPKNNSIILILLIFFTWSIGVIGLLGYFNLQTKSIDTPMSKDIPMSTSINKQPLSKDDINKNDIIFSVFMDKNGAQHPEGFGRIDGGIPQMPTRWYNDSYLWRIGPWVYITFDISNINQIDGIKLYLKHTGSGGAQERTIADIVVNDQPYLSGFIPLHDIENLQEFSIDKHFLKQGENKIILSLTPSYDKYVWWIKSIIITKSNIL